MIKEFSFSNDKAMINFTAKYCDSQEKILRSQGFQRLMTVYINKRKKRNSNVYKYITEEFPGKDDSEKLQNIIRLFHLLTVMTAEEIMDMEEKYKNILINKDSLIVLIEDVYSFWRKLERYTIVENAKITEGITSVRFEEANTNFSSLVLDLYRKIEEHVLGYAPKVYRQVPAGGNASLLLNRLVWPCPMEYSILEGIPFIDTISLETPFITYPKKNKRDGYFNEVNYNPVKECSLNKEHWFCFPIKVGELLAYIYFHRDFMDHGVSLCNLFEVAREEEYRGRKPDIIYVFGAKDNSEELKTIFYDDVKNDIMVGYVSHSQEIDYFGYMKKMTLTLHNLIMIKRGHLPIHGAMVNIILKNGKSANVVIVGDSGAGKSESLEAFRSLSEEYVSDMTIVFDDMGTLKVIDENIKGYGTEIGAFVRLDDLDQGYAFKEIDKSIFMNPDKTNARLVMPVASYKDIIKGYNVDLFLYANNFQEVKPGEKAIRFFDNSVEAINTFREGARLAKGTTTEKGLVKSYFANPFGPYQKQEETDKLLDLYFNKFFEKGIKVGEIMTCLALENMEKEGPRNAAVELFELIKNL
ncbi:hypothetical protein SAMN05444401_3489 [Clostridium amylolyticum]|uniref:Phosphoenolpyruvate carboxykinase n=1 Tax=Clostridium amylolyticum TaxID=1121298 RepID=A0A1M6KTG7_9CLOT|nr:phosphoenolpyruvate carboxykinase [Clostridium amylolyticum]SHJ62196.1 hypothetical protein SAMN05444401_3489 [Clostridium amylolyticum]